MIRLQAQNVTFDYGDEKKPVFKDLTFAVEPGTFGLLVGPSGCGKSTLFKLLAGLYPQYAGNLRRGSVLLDDQNIAEVRPFKRAVRVAMLFQNPSRQFAMKTVASQLRFALENLQLAPEQIKQRLEETLSAMHLQDFRDRVLMTLSGGEQQRVALATVLAMHSDLILLDEPFANVDPKGRSQLLADLKQIQLEQHKTILISDHDLSGYEGIADRLYQLKKAPSTVAALPLSELSGKTEVQKVERHPLNQGTFNWKALKLQVGDRLLLENSQFTLPEGQIGLLSGENGVGKSTFLMALSRQHDYQGAVFYQDKEAQKYALKKWALIVGLVFQNSSDQFIRLTARDELKLSLDGTCHPEYWKRSRIDAILARLNLTAVLDQVCYQLSGGQQKKLQLLSMLIMSQPVLLLDEPFAGLDAESLSQTLQLLRQTVKELNLAVLTVSHQRLGVVDSVDYELQLAEKRLTLLS